jgi:hypothetical protein
MTARLLGALLIVAGIGFLGISLAADVIGIGAQPGIVGWKQILGAVFGFGVAVLGILVAGQGKTTEGN